MALFNVFDYDSAARRRLAQGIEAFTLHRQHATKATQHATAEIKTWFTSLSDADTTLHHAGPGVNDALAFLTAGRQF